MRRRDLLSGLLATALGAPASAQRRAHVVGFVGFASQEADLPTVEALRSGLRALGHSEGETLVVVSRHAAGNLGRAAQIIDEMARMPVDVFVAAGPTAARSIRLVTQIPVITVGLPPSDPDLFQSLARPGGSVTGFSNWGEELSAKRIEVLREMLPTAKAVGVLHNVADPVFREWGKQTIDAALAQGMKATGLEMRSGDPGEATELLHSFARQDDAAVIVIRDFLTSTARNEIIHAATELRCPVVAENRAFVEAGGLLFYGADLLDLFRRAASYVDRVLKGEKPGDLPIQLPTKIEMVINLKAAHALGITIPPTLLARADEVLE
jgi:putative tryptophan/tyrosine transport system substrate-binding protein